MAGLPLISNGASKAGTTIDEAGTFKSYESTYNTKATYATIINRGSTNNLFVNFNSSNGAIDITPADNKTIIVPPNTTAHIVDELISDVTLFCDTGETTAVTYWIGRKKYINLT